MMNREAVTALYEDLHECSARVVATGKEHQPLLIPVVDGRVLEPLPLARYPKDKWAYVQREAAAQLEDTYTVLIVEAWVVTQSTPLTDTAVPPSKHPGRREAITFSFVGRGWQALALCLIDREKKSLDLGPLHFRGDPGVYFEGAMLSQPDDTGTIH